MSASRCFFSDAERVQALCKEGDSWIGTPFRPFSCARGRQGGADCIFHQKLYEAAGLVKPGEFIFPRITADYQPHNFESRILDYLRGKIWRDPQSERLAHLFSEIELPKFEGNPPDDLFMTGDLLLFRLGKPDQEGGAFHTAVMRDQRHFFTCAPEVGVVLGNTQDMTFQRHFIALFRAMEVAK